MTGGGKRERDIRGDYLLAICIITLALVVWWVYIWPMIVGFAQLLRSPK